MLTTAVSAVAAAMRTIIIQFSTAEKESDLVLKRHADEPNPCKDDSPLSEFVRRGTAWMHVP